MTANKAGRPRREGSHYSRRPIIWATEAKNLRLARGLTRMEVSVTLGVAEATIFDIEQGCNCGMATAFLLARFYGKTIPEVWPRLIDDPAPEPSLFSLSEVV